MPWAGGARGRAACPGVRRESMPSVHPQQREVQLQPAEPCRLPGPQAGCWQEMPAARQALQPCLPCVLLWGHAGGCQRGQDLGGLSAGGFVLHPLPRLPLPPRGMKDELCHAAGTLLCPARLPPALLPVASLLLVSEHCWVFWCRQGSCDQQLTPNSLGQFLVPAAPVHMGHLLPRPSVGPTGTGLCQEGEV